MPDGFVSMQAWLGRDPAVLVIAEPPIVDSPAEPEEAFDDLCCELRRFRAALLDALECASEGMRAELIVRCGTIETRIDLCAQRLEMSLA
jgi:hypothetical protein